MAVALGAVALAGVLPTGPRGAQRCRQPHYRWAQKIDTSLATLAPQPASAVAILGTWEPPHLGAQDRCAPRAGPELQVYRLTGWVRRVDKVKEDGDWHIELTERADSPVDSCIVVEIPAPRYSPRYGRARATLDSLIAGRTIRRGGALHRPVRAGITGTAFFDGQHRREGRRSDESDGEHGRCNTSVRALWEIHPVYEVTRP